MKRILMTLMVTMMAMVVFAASKNLENDITMVSYEQSWTDVQGTLALKNNTKEEVRNVTFIITYLDMDDKEMDYQEFQKELKIAPGMTKKINLPAYEYNRSYQYYETKDDLGGHTTFKIKFQLKDYNTDGLTEDALLESEDGRCDNSIITIWVIVACLIAISVTVGLYVLVALMAQRRGRNVALWVLLCIFASPVLIAIILLIVGDSKRDEIRNLE